MEMIDNGGYRFWGDTFSIQSAYEDCKAVFDGITDADSYQECDTGIILYHAHEIMYALKTVASSPQRKTGRWISHDRNAGNTKCRTLLYCLPTCSVCGYCADYTNFCPNCGAYMERGVN